MARTIAARAASIEHSVSKSLQGIFDTIRREDGRQDGNSLRRIGVCVSGGADSMALAYLLKQALVATAQERATPFAFIVDHNVREGSGEEAAFVQAQLGNIGLESHILRMTWNQADNPASELDFETRARQLRYRMIASAAAEKKIQHLFLGHHQDDQIETILMRLIRNSSDSFLGRQGISVISTIPCCGDKRSAQTVEQYERFGHWWHRVGGSQSHVSESTSTYLNHGKIVTPSRAGGIRLYRPLLPFRKSEILQFCEEKAIVYVQDPTNFDPTLTLRNAVRHLRTNYTLPRALRGFSISKLHEKAQTYMDSLSARGDEILQLVKIDVFDLRSGRMIVRLPPHFHSVCRNDEEAAAYALAKLTSMVSPCPRDDEVTLVPQHGLAEFLNKGQRRGRQQMTMQQVLLEKTEVFVSARQEPSTSEFREVNTQEARGEVPEGLETIWTLSRPPLRTNERDSTSLGFDPTWCWGYLNNAGKAGGWGRWPVEDEDKGVWSKWLLWDNRYWVRVRTKDVQRLRKVRIRAYAESDVQSVNKSLGDASNELQATLAETAPGKSRFTIPILTTNEKISGFPTLNVVVQKPEAKRQPSILEWEVCYKILDHPLIKSQINTIQWRNAAVKRTSYSGDRAESLVKALRYSAS